MGTTLIVANAPWQWEERFVRLVADAELVLAADGGANHLARIGVRPAAVVGDLDSILPETRAWLGERCLVHRPDQEFTDLDKTLAYAFDERGAERVTILAATGGRLDHALENLGLLARWSGRGPVEILAAGTRIVAVAGEAEIATLAGQTISLVPLGRCERVTTRGLRWPLSAEPLDLASRTGVSNRAEGASVSLRVEGGHLLVFLAELETDGSRAADEMAGREG